MPPIIAKDNEALNKTLVLVAILLAIFLAALTWKTLLESHQVGFAPRVPNTFTVNGEGKVSGKPTLAEVSLGLYSEGAEVNKVQDANTIKVNGLVDALKQMGISADDIQTANYNIAPKFEYTDGNSNVVGYTVTQTLNVKVRDLSKIGATVAKAGELGINQVNGVTFSLDDPSELQKQARTEAIADARAKAEELAKALGLSIVRITTFSESSNNAPQPPIFAYRAMDAAPAANPVPDIQSGSLDVKSDVSVTFEIR